MWIPSSYLMSLLWLFNRHVRMFKIKFLIPHVVPFSPIPSVPSAVFLIWGSYILWLRLKTAESKMIAFHHTPHSIHQQILLTPPLYYIQNLTHFTTSASINLVKSTIIFPLAIISHLVSWHRLLLPLWSFFNVAAI